MTSTALEIEQTLPELAQTRAENIINQPLRFKFPKALAELYLSQNPKIKAAVLREKGSNSEREMAYVMDCGFEVRDVHMTDLVEGETFEDIQLLVAVGGFSNSDVLGSAKWVEV